MPLLRLRLPALVLLLAVLLGVAAWRQLPGRRADDAVTSAPVAKREIAPAGSAARSVAPGDAGKRVDLLSRLAYAQAWHEPQSPALDRFRAWTERYVATASGPARESLIVEGVALARARRPEMLALIKTDPARALAVTVPATVRQTLPVAVLAELETRVSGRGDSSIWIGSTEVDGRRQRMQVRTATIGEVTYTPTVYGRRAAQLSKHGASLHGIALDGQLALHESPLRVLEPGEIPTGQAPAECLVSGDPVVLAGVEMAVNVDELSFFEIEGRTHEVCGAPLMAELLEDGLNNAEAGDDPQVRALSIGTPAPRRALGSARTIGAQKVLVIRVDFSDKDGDPVAGLDAKAFIEGTINSQLRSMSLGKTSMVPTVSRVYRMPKTAAQYGAEPFPSTILINARAAAAADHDLASFAYVEVVSKSMGHPSNGELGGTNLYLPGSDPHSAFSGSGGLHLHEFGHTLGLEHSDLWQTTDGNTISNAGTSRDYGDYFDIMSFGSSNAQTPYEYNAWFKYLLGWLPESAISTVTSGGTYRIYRNTAGGTAPDSQLRALRIARDGMRTYWIDYASGVLSANAVGAHVFWGYNSRQPSHVLNMVTPGSQSPDSLLKVGSSFTDPAFGITLRTLAASAFGVTPAWIDVQVTLTGAPPSSVVAAWGRNGTAFFSTSGPLLGSEANVPPGLTNVRAVAAGNAHALALKSDGTVVAWGDAFGNASDGPIVVPAGLTNVASVAAGGAASAAVRSDGTFVLWGESANNLRVMPAGVTTVRQLAIGAIVPATTLNTRAHIVALKTDGTVAAWGTNINGSTTVPAGLNNVIAVAAGSGRSYALKSDGTVVGWGTTGVAPPAGLSDVVAIAASGTAQHALALKRDGTVVAWGVNSLGQTDVPAGLTNVRSIAVSGDHSVAVKMDGTVVGWGSNIVGESDTPITTPRAHTAAAGPLATLAICGPGLYLTSTPVEQRIDLNGAATFSVTAEGAGALSYQWSRNGVAIAGATSRTLTIPRASASDGGSYSVTVTDAGSGTSYTTTGAALTFNGGVNGGHLVNLSVLAPISSAGDSFSLGYVVTGASAANPKPLVIRAAGPSLGAAFGYPGTLADPKLELFAGAAKTGENEDWGGLTSVSNAMAQVGAFAYAAANSRDAAVAANITTRDNSVKISAGASTPNGTGAVIAEVYDATPAANFNFATSPRLVNFSVIKSVGSSVTLGFVVGGNTPMTVLVRAVGPSLGLAPFNLGGVMANPKVELFSGNNKINENDDWGGGAALSAAFTATGAFTLPGTSRDSALIATLPPGQYSVVVTPAAGTAGGLALLEVYEVP